MAKYKYINSNDLQQKIFDENYEKKVVSDVRWEATYTDYMNGIASLHSLIFAMGECNRIDGMLWQLYGSCDKDRAVSYTKKMVLQNIF